MASQPSFILCLHQRVFTPQPQIYHQATLPLPPPIFQSELPFVCDGCRVNNKYSTSHESKWLPVNCTPEGDLCMTKGSPRCIWVEVIVCRSRQADRIPVQQGISHIETHSATLEIDCFPQLDPNNSGTDVEKSIHPGANGF